MPLSILVFSNSIFSTLPPCRSRRIILSLLQLIRKPAYLLRMLRPLRVAGGPVSIISTMAIATGQLKQDLTIFKDSAALPSIYLSASILHALSVLILAVIAGVIFRPDNMSVLQLLVPEEGKDVNTEELKIVGSKEGQLPLPVNVCTQLLKDLRGSSVFTSYSRRVEIHAVANAIVLFLCVARLICS